MKALKTLFFFLISLSFFNINSQEIVDHNPWDQILVLNVTDEGLVDYDGVTNDVLVFYKYFRYLQNISPEDHWSKEEKLAYWLNVYNATVMKMIIDEYPIASINQIENPWKRKAFKSNDIRYSLDDIEHSILRKFGDPRIHFLLNCGSMSSPRLWNRAYTSSNIDYALEERTKEFINDPQRNQINSKTVRISQLFEWYEDDFVSNHMDVIDFINEYSTITIDKQITKKYVTYDWSLNKNDKKTPITSNN
ncbi:Protein of unknown function, DUF547 [Aquimarina amphilecti]|uniref:DUF547 domain-containing protein n=1 Tax=Aquimarina amphilecti TaxID=1038014 RepID=A0A1H7SCZ8_AQUAM|nr:DUF547 domain-containing protein [Aquimarina amphilecti]SEL70521.1 Protein of unknown function, DUF547 [Aquimarina amphilecti]